jgi:hypothetical protein
VNSFKAEGEGLNFAVSVEEISTFVKSPSPSALPGQKAFQERFCEPARLFEGRNQAGDGDLVQIDSNCDGKADVSILVLDDKSEPIRAFIDSNFDDTIDIEVHDTNRDAKWDISFHDVDFDGSIDVVGYHPDGKLSPSRYERAGELLLLATRPKYQDARQSQVGFPLTNGSSDLQLG